MQVLLLGENKRRGRRGKGMKERARSEPLERGGRTREQLWPWRRGCPVSCHRVTDPIMFQIGTRDRANVPLPSSFLLEQLSSNTIVHHGRPLESLGTKGRYFRSFALPPTPCVSHTIDH